MISSINEGVKEQVIEILNEAVQEAKVAEAEAKVKKLLEVMTKVTNEAKAEADLRASIEAKAEADLRASIEAALTASNIQAKDGKTQDSIVDNVVQAIKETTNTTPSYKLSARILESFWHDIVIDTSPLYDRIVKIHQAYKDIKTGGRKDATELKEAVTQTLKEDVTQTLKEDVTQTLIEARRSYEEEDIDKIVVDVLYILSSDDSDKEKTGTIAELLFGNIDPKYLVNNVPNEFIDLHRDSNGKIDHIALCANIKELEAFDNKVDICNYIVKIHEAYGTYKKGNDQNTLETLKENIKTAIAQGFETAEGDTNETENSADAATTTQTPTKKNEQIEEIADNVVALLSGSFKGYYIWAVSNFAPDCLYADSRRFVEIYKKTAKFKQIMQRSISNSSVRAESK
jgi:hypothetical protein